MLSDRRQIVLKALIEEYINCALPVGSRRLVERYNLGISSATVRNELSLLEEMGYLIQPHTSAGRVPTDFGYRAFVDDLLSRDEASQADEATKEELRQAAGDLDDLVERTSAALSRLTDCMTLVVPPRFLSVDVKLISLVPIAPDRLVAVVVTEDGQVYDRQVVLPTPCSADKVSHTEELLNRVLSGHSVSAGTNESSIDLADVDDDLFPLVLSEIMACLRDRNAVRGHPLGMAHLLDKPEFAESARLTPVLEELEGDTMLLRVFDDAMSSDGPVVRIGHENDSEALRQVSIIANRFGEESHSGLIVIVGPTRMDYSNVIRAVRAAQDILNDQ